MTTIKEVLMNRDNMTSKEADRAIKAAKEDLEKRLANPGDYDNPYDICQDHFGLEPDYLLELI